MEDDDERDSDSSHYGTVIDEENIFIHDRRPTFMTDDMFSYFSSDLIPQKIRLCSNCEMPLPRECQNMKRTVSECMPRSEYSTQDFRGFHHEDTSEMQDYSVRSDTSYAEVVNYLFSSMFFFKFFFKPT